MRLKQLEIGCLTVQEQIESYCLSNVKQDFDRHAQLISDWLTNATIREIDDLPDNTILKVAKGLGWIWIWVRFPRYPRSSGLQWY